MNMPIPEKFNNFIVVTHQHTPKSWNQSTFSHFPSKGTFWAPFPKRLIHVKILFALNNQSLFLLILLKIMFFMPHTISRYWSGQCNIFYLKYSPMKDLSFKKLNNLYCYGNKFEILLKCNSATSIIFVFIFS